MSLYAAQTRELPILNADSYAFLNKLVDGLVRFPSLKEPDQLMMERDHVVGSELEHVVRSRCLRAALGIARTLFSIGVVARFADFPRLIVPKPPSVGYFEHHRLMLWWLVHEARRLESANVNMRKTFYQDDIVWLYNECGVFSLAQGQCYDAVATLNRALKEAQKIEGSGEGSMSHRIRLNLGICEITRGRLKAARRLLTRVKDDRDKNEFVRVIAYGYIAHIDHLEGSLEEAAAGYGAAIMALEKMGRSRAVSIFKRYRADLWRYHERYDEAEKDLVGAIDVAKRAGYEDMVRFALVSLVRVQA